MRVLVLLLAVATIVAGCVQKDSGPTLSYRAEMPLQGILQIGK